MRRLIIMVTCLISIVIAASFIYSGHASAPPYDKLPLLQQLARDNTAFGMELYAELRSKDGNLFFSPYSISEAITMLYAGARGETADEIAEALHISLSDDELHQAYRAQLSFFDAMASAPKDEKTKINIANGFWTQKGIPLKKEYTSLLRTQHLSKPASLNFEKDTDKARKTINTWVSHKTHGLVKNLLPQGALNADTQLVLANTVYFDATWGQKFNGHYTRNADFNRLDNTTVSVPMMRVPKIIMMQHRYTEGVDWQAVELTYTHRPDMNGMAMLILLPRPGHFSEVESQLDEEFLTSIISSLNEHTVKVVLPKFTFTSPTLDMKEILTDLGMITVFDSVKADLSGIRSEDYDPLFLGNVHHKASITVAEDGTVASAGTELKLRPAGVPIEFTVDRPFIFLIRDLDTNAVLFMGRVLDPTE